MAADWRKPHMRARSGRPRWIGTSCSARTRRAVARSWTPSACGRCATRCGRARSAMPTSS
eukprot:12919361-Alexandrium_andersonii.AAC.1